MKNMTNTQFFQVESGLDGAKAAVLGASAIAWKL